MRWPGPPCLGHQLPLLRGQAWAGQGQATHQPAQQGLRAGAMKSPRPRAQSAVPEAIAFDPWSPGRLQERNMEAITPRAAV